MVSHPCTDPAREEPGVRSQQSGPLPTCTFAGSAWWWQVTPYTLKRNSTTSPSCIT